MTNRPDILQQARAMLASGRVADAAQFCSMHLATHPGNAELHHLRGRCRASLGHWQKAADDYRQAMLRRPGFLPAMVDFGIARASMGDYAEARSVLERAHAIDSSAPLLHYGLGLALLGLGELEGAAIAFAEALRRKPLLYDAWHKLGALNLQLGRPTDARRCFERALELQPNDATAAAALGGACLADKDFPAAVHALQRAFALDDRRADVAANLGEAYRNVQDVDRAAAWFERTLAIAPDLAEAHLGLAKLAAGSGDIAAAESLLLRALRLKPDDGELALTAAATLEHIGQPDRALHLLLALHAPETRMAPIWHARGVLQLRAGDLNSALVSFDNALRMQPTHADSWLARGKALEACGQHEQAMECIEQSLAIRPSHADSLATLVSCALRACDWTRLERSTARLLASPAGVDAMHPFLLLNVDMAPAERFSALQRRSSRLPVSAPTAARVREFDSPLRVAYLSPDFREHPVAHALAGVIEAHDRRRIVPIGVALQTPAMQGIGLRLHSSFDEFIDVSTATDRIIADRLRELRVDVAIDLAGHTTGAKPGVFGHRAAPIQVSFLGYPSSTGAPCMDYIIADRIVAPAGDESLYSETIVRMPHCYLPFDAGRPAAGTAMRRTDVHLPESEIIFCAFNNAYKITRRMFSAWLRLLEEIPGSVLWLRSMGTAAATNLRLAAVAAGIGPERLVFAPYLTGLPEHIDRLQLADIFLDTTPYNAHTSATEALWAGVPVITVRGNGFAGRVGASLLTAAGLPELITADLDAYVELALQLARSPALLEDCKRRVRQSHSTAPLFDTPAYMRDFEALLMGMSPRLSHS